MKFANEVSQIHSKLKNLSQKLNWTEDICDIISEDSHTLPPERRCHCTERGQSRA